MLCLSHTEYKFKTVFKPLPLTVVCNSQVHERVDLRRMSSTAAQVKNCHRNVGCGVTILLNSAAAPKQGISDVNSAISILCRTEGS